MGENIDLYPVNETTHRVLARIDFRRLLMLDDPVDDCLGVECGMREKIDIDGPTMAELECQSGPAYEIKRRQDRR